MSILRLITSVAVSLALVQGAVAVPSQTVPAVAERALSIYPVGIELTPLNNVIIPSKRMTNAQRMARGLSPNPPVRRAPGHLKARQSATPTSSDPVSSTPVASSSAAAPSDTPTSSAASSSASPSDTPSSVASSSASPSSTPISQCTTYNGYLKARYTSPTGQYTDGYVSNAMNSHGQWGFTHATSSALAVSYEQCADSTAPVSLLVTNVLTSYPIIAAVTGVGNLPDKDILKAGSYNWAYIAGTGSDVPYGTDPQPQANSFSTASGFAEDVETANHIVNPLTGAISVQWYNKDGTAPATTLAYVTASSSFAIVGDLNAFANRYGTTYRATFTFITTLPESG